MIVTGIEEVSRSRSKVCLEGDFAFVLYKGEIRFYGIREGEDLPEESCREILDELLPKRATLRCMHLLKDRAYTEGQLRRKLAEGHYPPEQIDGAVAYVESYHYIDDFRYACTYIRFHQSQKSRLQLKLALLQRGVPAETAEQAIEEEYGDCEEELIQKFLEKKQYDPEQTDWKEKQKICQSLARKGFPISKIKRLMDLT